MKRFLKTSAFLVVALVVGVVWLQSAVNGFMQSPMQIAEEGLDFEIAPGSSFSKVTSNLMEAGAIDDDRWFQLYVRYTEQGGAIQAGEYELEAGTTPLEALAKFTSGEVRLHAFTIVEGWNHRELLAAMKASESLNVTMTEEDWPALMLALDAYSMHPEGLFLPETYRFPRGTSDRELLRQAYELMLSTLEEEWEARGPDAAVNDPYEALILASIVEKETARADERPRIAGVFARRLISRMRLQTDPTVIYGIGPSFNGDLTRKDLRTDTPYNTYTRHGLPPTPIAMPGRAAINAVLHPADGTELYFVATGLPDGSHKFSTTKDEHDAAVAEYLRQLRRNRNKGP